MKMKVEIEISGQRIADLMSTAIESGDAVTRGWCVAIRRRSFNPVGDDKLWYSHAVFWDGNFTIEVVELDDEKTGHETKHLIDPSKMKKGIQIMAEKHPHHFADIIQENEDAGTADTFLQCVVFGEEKYG